MKSDASPSTRQRNLRFSIWVLALAVWFIAAARSPSWTGGAQALLAMLGLWFCHLAIDKFAAPARKAWFYLAAGSALLFVLIVVLPATAQGSVLLGAITWATVTALGTFLLWFYRKTAV